MSGHTTAASTTSDVAAPSVQFVLRSLGASYRAETEITILNYHSLTHNKATIPSNTATISQHEFKQQSNGKQLPRHQAKLIKQPLASYKAKQRSRKREDIELVDKTSSREVVELVNETSSHTNAWSGTDATSPVELLLCEGVTSVSRPAVDIIVAWVREGGALVATRSCATVNEVGRCYEEGSLFVSAFGEGGEHCGNGTVLFVNASTLSMSPTAVTKYVCCFVSFSLDRTQTSSLRLSLSLHVYVGFALLLLFYVGFSYCPRHGIDYAISHCLDRPFFQHGTLLSRLRNTFFQYCFQ
jgi:hypothetical protein